MANCQQGHRSHWRFRLEGGGYLDPGVTPNEGVWSPAVAVNDGGDGFIRGDERADIGGIGGISRIATEKIRKQAGGTLAFNSDYDMLNWFFLAFMGNSQSVDADVGTLWDNFYDPVDDQGSLEHEGRKGGSLNSYAGATYNRLTFAWTQQEPLTLELEAFANLESIATLGAGAQPIKTAKTVLPRHMTTFLMGANELNLQARTGQIVLTRQLDPQNFPAAFDGRAQPCPGGWLQISGTVGLYYTDTYQNADATAGQITNWYNEPLTEQLQISFDNAGATPAERGGFELICPRAQVIGDPAQFSSPGVVEVSLAWEALLGDISGGAFGTVGTGVSPAFVEVPGVARVSGPFDAATGFVQ